MLKAWLRVVIEQKLRKSICWTVSIKDIWTELEGRYSTSNAPRVHQLRCELNECKQGSQSVVEYYTRLKTLWDELDNYSCVPKCTCGAASSLLKEKEEERVHQFFMGLNSKIYANIRSSLLMEDEVTTMIPAYAIVLRDERHQTVTRIGDGKSENVESAMVVQVAASQGGNKPKPESDSNIPYCTHCGKKWNLESDCWEKIGYPSNRERGGRAGGRGGRRGGRGRGARTGGRGDFAGAAAVSGGDKHVTAEFTSEEIARLRSLLTSNPENKSENLSGPIYEDHDWTG